MLCVIASTRFEISILLEHLGNQEEITIQGKTFYTGQLDRLVPVTLCICGVGKANAAHATAIAFERFRPESVCIIGVAGAYPSSGLGIGDIVIAEKEVYGDEGLLLENGFHPLDELFGAAAGINSEFGIRNEFQMSVPDRFKDFKNRGIFVTVSGCTGTLKKGLELERQFSGLCENMEGAAVAHICALNNIRPTEIRAISNIIEDRKAAMLSKSDLLVASENVQRFILKVLPVPEDNR